MAVPSSAELPAASTVIYTCPMHPLFRHAGPGHCPFCGMSLEVFVPKSAEEDNDAESRAMTRRLWVSAGLTLPLLLMSMRDILPFDPSLGEQGCGRARMGARCACERVVGL